MASLRRKKVKKKKKKREEDAGADVGNYDSRARAMFYDYTTPVGRRSPADIHTRM